MTDESEWIHRAQSAEARLATHKEASDQAIERIQQFKANFGVREKSDGSIEINFDKFAQALGIDNALALRAVIDETYNISGVAGEKPRVRVNGAAA